MDEEEVEENVTDDLGIGDPEGSEASEEEPLDLGLEDEGPEDGGSEDGVPDGSNPKGAKKWAKMRRENAELREQYETVNGELQKLRDFFSTVDSNPKARAAVLSALQAADGEGDDYEPISAEDLQDPVGEVAKLRNDLEEMRRELRQQRSHAQHQSAAQQQRQVQELASQIATNLGREGDASVLPFIQHELVRLAQERMSKSRNYASPEEAVADVTKHLQPIIGKTKPQQRRRRPPANGSGGSLPVTGTKEEPISADRSTRVQDALKYMLEHSQTPS